MPADDQQAEPDVGRLVYVDNDFSAWTIGSDGTDPRRIAGGSPTPPLLGATPGGNGSTPTLAPPEEALRYTWPTWSPDGRRMALSRSPGFSAGAIASLRVLPLGLRLGYTAISYVDYLVTLVWPVGLSVYYPFPIAGLPTSKLVLSLLLFIALTTAPIAGAVTLAMDQTPSTTVSTSDCSVPSTATRTCLFALSTQSVVWLA